MLVNLAYKCCVLTLNEVAKLWYFLWIVDSARVIVFVIGGSALVLRRVIRWREEGPMVPPEGKEDDVGEGVSPGSAARAIGIWGVTLVYVGVLRRVGYIVATPVFLAVVLRMLGYGRQRIARVIPVYVALSVVFTAVAFVVFVEGLGGRLPLGFTRQL